MKSQGLLLQSSLLVLFSFVFFITNMPYILPYNGLDGTWHCTQAMAFDKGFIFGTEYTFTYGPLAFLNTHVLPQKVSVWWMVAFHCFVLFNYLEIIKEGFRRFPENILAIGILSVVILFPWGFFADITFTLFIFLLFWLLKLEQQHSAKGMLLTILLVVLIFFIKQNLSLIAIGLTVVSFIYFILIKKLTWTIAGITLLIEAILIFGLAKLFNVSLLDYVRSGMLFVSGYPEASSDIQIPKQAIILYACLEFLIICCVLAVVLKNIRLFINNLFLYALIGIAFFLGFKQSHIALGYLNLFGFFLFLPALACLFKIFLKDKNPVFSRNTLLGIVLIQMIATQYTRFQMSGGQYAATFAGQIPKNWSEVATKSPLNYFVKAIGFEHEMNFDNAKEQAIAKMEPRILQKIGQKSVDLIPFAASYIYFNKLNYRPRPTPQSYANKTAELMQLNGAAYEKPTRPDFVLYTLESFREQNPFWNETQVAEALLKHYEIVDSTRINNQDYLLFEVKPNNRQLKTISKKTKQYNFEQTIELPVAKDYFKIEFNFEYSLLGKISRFFLQPPYLYYTVTYSNGKKENFRAMKRLLEGGIIASAKVTKLDEAKQFFSGNMQQNQQIRTIQFHSPFRKGFENTFSITIEEVKISNQ